MPGTYQYEPGNIAEYGKDRMRFELGDVMVEGKEKTCALCDEEYNAVLPEKIPTTRQWKKAKLRCLDFPCPASCMQSNRRILRSL